MQRSKAISLFAVVICAAISGCSGLSEQTYTHEAWAESQHPASDKITLPEGCKAVKYDGGYVPIITTVDFTGKNCVVHDFIQRQRYHAHDSDRSNQGNPGGEGVISFYRINNADLDLRNHLISSAPFDDAVGITTMYMAGNTPINLRIHNGTVITPGTFGVGITLASILNFEYLLKQNLEDKHFDDLSVSSYKSTRYTAENLHIQSGGRGIIMSGADNVVRNNVIEVDGKVAVYLYGPRPIIEGNTFIIKLSDKDKATLPAALKLRDADGAIIRNNRFIVQSSGFTKNKAEAAINLLSSNNVLIENNIVENTSTLLRKDEVSNATERGNQMK
ncbi:right-handed parallel beta-helix repeat-containing protein [Undibacterium sp. SXout11W]|uniref:right-handed parallel beta-helix repeat-containing protein n=1 Tax=Undibacterium sp. SXout11W TaxID=3413050 RepID=UPI003BF01CA7